MTATDKAIIEEIELIKEHYERELRRLNDRVDALVVEVDNLSKNAYNLKKKG